jgi:LmbE family N-acetylglucosaminyl deacetylase
MDRSAGKHHNEDKKRDAMKALLFFAHPDDEVIGAGGTIRKLADAGAAIRLVTFSEGAEGYTQPGGQTTIVAQRAKEVAAVCRILGIQEHGTERWLDWDFRVSNAGYHAVIRHIREFQPDVIFTHSFADYNDHKVVHDTVVDGWFHAAVPCAMRDGPVWKHVPLYECEILQSLAEPSVVVDVSDTYAAKVAAMQAYGSQLDLVGGIFQLMDGRAQQRGYQIGAKYGEAFRRVTTRPCKVTDVARLLE